MGATEPPLRRRIVRKLWFVAWVLFALGVVCPINQGLTRLALLAGLTGLWSGALYLFWSRTRFRWISLALPLAGGTFLLLPGRQADPISLRAAYVRQLPRYEGTRYVWGGESRFAIDCSGLVRRALMDANIRTGLRTVNPRLLRRALCMWWFDSSAEALRDGYRDQTRLVLKADSINELDHERILPGDLAVTASGIHVLAYLGKRMWIQATTEAGRTIVVRAPSDTDPWFVLRIHVVRWRQLEVAEQPVTGRTEAGKLTTSPLATSVARARTPRERRVSAAAARTRPRSALPRRAAPSSRR